MRSECREQEQELDGDVRGHSLGLAASEIGVCVYVCARKLLVPETEEGN